MRGLYSGLALWNLLVLGVTAVLGALAGEGGPVSPEVHRVLGLFAAVFCCLVHSILITHFIGSMKWIQQTGPTAGIDDTKPLRTAWIRGRTFPTLVAAMLVTVAAAAAGGQAADGLAGMLLHAGLALAVFPLNVLALVWGRASVAENTRRLRDVEHLALERQQAGLVREAEVEALRPESGRAGGRTLLFLAANVWVLWLYRRHVLRHVSEPWWPYAVACALLALVGWSLLRRWSGSSQAAAAPTRSASAASSDGKRNT
jgi:energy-converting hydrogenase Eha subunit A